MDDENLDERTVEVLQIPDDVDDDLLSLYFEGRRSGGGVISSLERNEDKAVIVFERAEDAVNVLSRPSHILSETMLLVRKKPLKDKKKFLLRGLSSSTSLEILELLVENLTGVDQGSFDLYKPPGKDLALVALQEPVAEGLQKVRERLSKKTLEGASLSLEEVEYTDSVLVKNLPPAVSEDLLTLYFESPRTGGGEVTEVSMIGHGAARVSFRDVEAVNAVLQKPHRLEDVDLSVTPYYSFLSVEANTPSAEPEAPDLMPVDEPDPGAPVCLDLPVPDAAVLEFLGSGGLLDDLRSAYPEFQMGVTRAGVAVTGPGRDRAEALRNALLETVGTATQAQVPVGELKCALLQEENVKRRLAAALRDRGVRCVCTVSGGALVLTSSSTQELDRAREVIDAELVESVVPLESGHESMLHTLEWRNVLETLECRAQVAQEGKCVLLVSLRDDQEEIKSRILHFLSTPIQMERVLSMEPAMLQYLQLHHQQLLMEMGAVVLFPLDTGDGLSIQGDPVMCQSVWELLSGIVSGTLTKTLTVKQPGIARFLRQDEGASILGEMTVKFQVYISLEKVHWEPLEDQDVFELAWRMMSSQNLRRHVAMDSTATDHLQEARRILAGVGSDLSSEPSSLRVTGPDEDMDLYRAHLETEDVEPSSLIENPGALDDDAGLSLAIQMSMEANRNPDRFAEDLQKVLELSKADVVDESAMLSRVVLDSLQDSARSANVAEIKVFASYPHDLVRVDIALGKKVGQRQRQEKLEHTCFRKLSSFHRRSLELIMRKHAVEVQVQGTTAVVSGFRDYVAEAMPDLLRLTRRAADAATDAEILRTVQWARHGRGGGGAEPYSPEAVVYMESAWRDKQEKIDVLFDGQPYTIDFHRMQEYSVSSGRSEKISRRILSSLDLYSGEEYSLISDVPDVVRLEESSAEFKEVMEEFRRSIQDKKVQIIQVEKLMNHLLYSQYLLKKQDLEQKVVMSQVERTLYHGTGESSVKEICIHGFNRSFCGKNATVYGQGVYFAVQSSLSFSDTYSPPNAEGHKFIFVAKVLTGEFTVGTSDMRAAPLKESSGIPVRYHSVVDRMDDPSMFIIFNDTQAYPQYLLTCQKVGA